MIVCKTKDPKQKKKREIITKYYPYPMKSGRIYGEKHKKYT